MHAYRALITLGLALATSSALAHPGHESASFLSGFAHPFAGLDHLLAMFAVGLYAVSHARRARWLLPAVFVLAMLAGAGLGALGVAVPAVEAGIAASVLVFGLLIAFVVRLPLATALPLVAVFALFHGHAHHAEMGDGTLAAYAVGFALATALLHAAGWLMGRCLPQTPWAIHAQRVTGGLIAGAGVMFLGT
jgi:urease accessory protein